MIYPYVGFALTLHMAILNILSLYAMGGPGWHGWYAGALLLGEKEIPNTNRSAVWRMSGRGAIRRHNAVPGVNAARVR